MIVGAKYGSNGKYNDVYNIIKNIKSDFIVSNKYFGDPIYGIVKELIIEFDDGTIKKFIENSLVNIGTIIANDIFEKYKLSLNPNNSIGFIILRHISKKEHNFLWLTCYNSIRKFYDNPILIIDDNSNKELVSNRSLTNTTIINSEYKGRGELLPYYYFYKLKPFNRAIILHDSMFIQNKLDIEKEYPVKFLWHFQKHDYDDTKTELEYISKLNNKLELTKFYKNKNQWYGCFGVASIINYEFIKLIQEKYNFFNLLDIITTRKHRMGLERIFACLCFFEKNVSLNDCSIFGSIFDHHMAFKYTYEKYTKTKCNQDLIKVWSGR
ncbi:hypothetical protein Indivirus_6_29 [Indivirus ILV1]|uniref:Uncharacterized protein n=1 Tax=Indivirus ILV1 TaxID=1977633 RepID=A0A1V0SE25_9VIRU|nr:hypothetical protein Indivirus_6_29 [Indivirus ILV1]